MGDYNPEYMIDCSECGSQMWHLESFTDESVRVKCGQCGITDPFMLNGSFGVDCLDCGGYVWTVKEYIEDEHLMLECDDCGVIAEIWLRGDELNAQD